MYAYIVNKLAGSAAASTLKKRIPFLNQLRMIDPESYDFGFLNHIELVMKRVQKSSNIDTQWNCLWHIIAACKSAPEVIDDKTLAYYLKTAESMKIERDEKQSNNKRTDKQVITLETDLTKRQNQLDAKIADLFMAYDIPYKIPTPSKYKTIKDLNTFAKQLQELVICGAYLYQPALRNDWGSLSLTTRLTGNDTSKNHLYIRGNTMRLIMNVFKNSKTMGQVIIDIRPKLVELLKIWLSVLTKINGSKPLHPLYYNITKTKCEFIENDEAIRRQLPRITAKVFGLKDKDDEPVGMSINDFRHLWEIAIQTDPAYATMTEAARKALHRELLHGNEIARFYNVH